MSVITLNVSRTVEKAAGIAEQAASGVDQNNLGRYDAHDPFGTLFTYVEGTPMMRNKLVPAIIVLLGPLWIGCSPQKGPPIIRKSAADGGPEDPAILVVENLGGSCFRQQWVKETLVEEDRFWLQEAEGNPVICVCIDECHDPDTLLAHLQKLPHLQDLCIRRTPLTDEHAKVIGSLRELRCLRLEDTRITSTGLRSVAALSRLQHLNFSFNDTSDDGLRELATLRELQVLYVGGTKITDAGLRHIGALEHLRRLHVWGSCVTDKGLQELVGLKDLTELNLGQSKVSGPGLKHIGEMKSLASLTLSATPMSSSHFTHLRSLSRLRELHLAYAESVNDEGLEALASLPQMEELDLSNTAVTDVGLRKLAPSTSLRSITVRETKVTPAGITRFRRHNERCTVVLHSDSW